MFKLLLISWLGVGVAAEFIPCGALRFSNANTISWMWKMEFVGRSTSLNIIVVVLRLLVLVQLPGLSASGLLIDSNSCGTYHIGYSDDLKERLFYIDGKLVERNLFCKALKFYQENHCFIRGNARNQHCSLYDSLGKIHSPYTCPECYSVGQNVI